MRTRDILLISLATLVIFGSGLVTGALLMRSRGGSGVAGGAGLEVGTTVQGGGPPASSPAGAGAAGTSPVISPSVPPGPSHESAIAAAASSGPVAPLFPGRFNTLSAATEQLADLTPAQRRRIQNILRDGREHLADFFLLFEPDVQQVFRKMREEVRGELTPDQRRRMEEWLKQRPRRTPDRSAAVASEVEK